MLDIDLSGMQPDFFTGSAHNPATLAATLYEKERISCTS
jgi:hypothetical protein